MKAAGQTVRVRRLACTCVVRIQRKQPITFFFSLIMTEILLIGTLINQSINQDKHRARCLVLKFGLNLCVCASREGLSQAAYAQAYLSFRCTARRCDKYKRRKYCLKVCLRKNLNRKQKNLTLALTQKG